MNLKPASGEAPAGMQRVAAVFSPAVMRVLGGREDAANTTSRLAAVTELVSDQPEASLGDAFSTAEALLRRYYRNEYIYKNDLVSRLVFGRHSPRTASVVLEVPMGESCADVMVLNGTSTIYEIKTDLDQLTRLSKQLRSYSTRAEHVNVVIGEKRASDVGRLIPQHVGLLVARPNGSMTTVRRSQSNLDRLDLDHLYQLLRTGEAQTVLRNLTGYELDVPAGHSWKRMRQLFDDLPVADAHTEVVRVLKLRGTLAGRLASEPDFPAALRALTYATALNPTRVGRTRMRLAQPAAIFAS